LSNHLPQQFVLLTVRSASGEPEILPKINMNLAEVVHVVDVGMDLLPQTEMTFAIDNIRSATKDTSTHPLRAPDAA
jgi:hypothetical protein